MFSRWTQTAISLALGSALLITGCSSGLVKSLSDLNALRQHLIQKYHDDVGVNLQNSRFLSIVFINSPMNKQGTAKRAERAQDAATFTALNYEGLQSIERIWISFVASETRFIVFHYSEGIESFAFDKNGVPVNAVPVNPDARTPVATFSSARNETDISVTRLQLEGDLDHGIALAPHFTVPGKLDPSGKAPMPKAVTFDFASYAKRKIFSKSSPLIIQGDDKAIYLGSAELLIPDVAGPNADSAPQFLRAEVPFEQFVTIANAHKVRIKLGPKEFQLAPEDVRALRGMAAYVAPAHGLGK